jgi:hypothetical protein
VLHLSSGCSVQPIPLSPGHPSNFPWGYFLAFSLIGQQGNKFGWPHQDIDQIANWALSIYGKFEKILKIKITFRSHSGSSQKFVIYLALPGST